jgi:hypothetical protein
VTSTSVLNPRAPVLPGPAKPRSVLAAWPLLLLLGWSAQVAIRLFLGHGRSAPAAFPDEGGYLLAARWLAGGPAANLSGSTFYQGGYPLLLAPVFWVAHDPRTCFRLVVGVNALAGAGIFPLGHVALRRLRLTRAAAYALAFAVALLPAAVVFDGLALTDAILPTVVLAWLLALHAFLRSREVRPAVVAGSAASLAASYAYATHARGSVILLVHVAVLVVAYVARRAARAPVAPVVVSLLVTGAGAGGGWALNRALRTALYPGGALDLGGILSSRLSSASGLGWTVFGAAGQLWYLIVSTWGLAGLGLAATVAALVRRGTAPVSRIMAAVLLAATLGTALASSAALPDEHRVGNFAYGRYLTCVAVAYALAGVAVLARRRAVIAHALAAVILLAGTGLAVVGHAGQRLHDYTYIAFDFPETSFLTWDWTSLRLGTASAAAVALLTLFVLVTATRRPAVAIAAGLAAFNLVAVTVMCKPWVRVREAIAAPGPPAGGVAVDQGVNWRVSIRQEYEVWWTAITVFDKSQGRVPPGTCLVIVAPAAGTAPEDSWPAHPAGWRVATVRPAPVPWVSWRSPSCHRPVT